MSTIRVGERVGWGRYHRGDLQCAINRAILLYIHVHVFVSSHPKKKKKVCTDFDLVQDGHFLLNSLHNEILFKDHTASPVCYRLITNRNILTSRKNASSKNKREYLLE